MSASDASELAEELHQARLDRREVERITDRYRDFGLDDAYEVQARGVALRLGDGETVVGGKLGFTSRAMQEAMGVDQPNFGMLTDAMVVHDGVVHLDGLIHPKVEPEIAFLIGTDLAGADVGLDDVLAATAGVLPCLEVVDSRFHDFKFEAYDNIADNSSAAELVLGASLVPPEGLDLSLIGATMSADGELQYTASGAAALGHPAEAVAWMARAWHGAGRGLEAGDIVISGGLTAPIDLRPGLVVTAEMDRLGIVELRCE